MKKYKMGALLLCGALTGSIFAGCGREKKEEPIPITTVSQSMVDEEPLDTLSEEEETEYVVELPENPDSFTIALWDEIYEIPVSYKAFTAYGWEFGSDESRIIEGQTYSEESCVREGNGITVDLVNPDTMDHEVSECEIGGIRIDAHSVEGQGVYAQLPGSVILQKSSIADVLNIYGEPKDRYEEAGEIQLTYEFGLYQNITLCFEAETGLLFRIGLKNIVLHVEQQDLSEVSSEITEEVKAYEAPAEESLLPTDFVVAYDGVLYQLPAPVCSFTEQGWTVDTAASDLALAADTYGSVTMEKGNSRIYGTIRNMGTEATTVENCFLTVLYGDLDTVKVAIRTAGITLGMPEEAMTELLGAAAEKTEDAENGLLIYTLFTDESRVNYVEVRVDSTLHLVRGIRIVNNERCVKEEEPSETEQEEQAGEQAKPDGEGGTAEALQEAEASSEEV